MTVTGEPFGDLLNVPGGTERKRKRTTAVQWNNTEVESMYTLLLPKYSQLNERFKGGSKTGPTPRQELLLYLSTELQAIGFQKSTTHIEDKIRNDFGKIRKKISAEKVNLAGTGGGPGIVVPIIPPYLEDFEALIRKECSTTGIPGATEVCGSVQTHGDVNLEDTMNDSMPVFNTPTQEKGSEAYFLRLPLRSSTPTKKAPKTPRFQNAYESHAYSIEKRNEVLDLQKNIERESEKLVMMQQENEASKARLIKLKEEVLKEEMAAHQAKRTYYATLNRLEEDKNRTVFENLADFVHH